MLRNRRKDILIALALIAPFVAIYALVFVYPTIQMFRISFTDAPLIGEGKWVGIDNYARLGRDPLFEKALWNTAYFVLMTVAPGTLIALLISLGVSRLTRPLPGPRSWRCSSCPTSCRSRWST